MISSCGVAGDNDPEENPVNGLPYPGVENGPEGEYSVLPVSWTYDGTGPGTPGYSSPDNTVIGSVQFMLTLYLCGGGDRGCIWGDDVRWPLHPPAILELEDAER